MPVRARGTWERDGAEGVDGTATRFGFDGVIYVELRDRQHPGSSGPTVSP